MSAMEPRVNVTGTRIALDPRLLDLLRRRLPDVATHTIAAVTDEVPSYAGAFGGPMGDNIENAVQMALAGFLRLAARGRSADQATPLSPALDGAYALGRGEARSGRSADALLRVKPPPPTVAALNSPQRPRRTQRSLLDFAPRLRSG